MRIRIEIQDTPIQSIRAEWTQGDTDYVAEVPLSWGFKFAGYKPTDSIIMQPSTRRAVLRHCKKHAALFASAILREFPGHVTSLTCCPYAPIPEIFGA